MTSYLFAKAGSRRAPLATLAWMLPLVGLTALAGCGTYNSLTHRFAQTITPYQVTVVQGNFVSMEAVAKLHVGMSRADVRAALGTPLLTDMFHADRWDYIFYFKRGSTSVVQQRDLVVLFANDQVSSWSGGNDLPSEAELIAEIDGDRRASNRAAQEAARSRAAAAAAASGPSAAAVAAAASGPVAANRQAAAAANQLTSAPLPQVAPTTGAAAPVPNTPSQGNAQVRLQRPARPDNASEVQGAAFLPRQRLLNNPAAAPSAPAQSSTPQVSAPQTSAPQGTSPNSATNNTAP